MARMNWSRLNSQARMQKYGREDVRGAEIPAPAGWKSRGSSSRGVAEALAKERGGITVTCLNCPYTATLAVAPRPGMRFRCSQCGARGTLAKKV